MDVLGTTIEAIATEKAQIIKRGDFAAVTGATEPGLGVIRRRAARRQRAARVTSRSRSSTWTAMASPSVRRKARKSTVGLLGQHQAANAAVAWGILDALSDAGIATVSTSSSALPRSPPRAGRVAWS